MLVHEITVDECRAVLTRMRVGRLACARENQPYIIPFHFAYDDHGKHNAYDGNRELVYSPTPSLYAFSMPGQKIGWMRANPLVCVEVDEIKRQDEWVSVVIFGRYEELPDSPQIEAVRAYAHNLFSRHAMWWQPAFAATDHRGELQDPQPIYFRILIEQMTGRRAVADPSEEQGQAERPAAVLRWWDDLWAQGKSGKER
jgi:uncharacterized protein